MDDITLEKSGELIFIQDNNRTTNTLYKLTGNTNELTSWVYIKPIFKLLLEEHKKIEINYLKELEALLANSKGPEDFRKKEEDMIENSMIYASEYIPKYMKSIESLIKKENIYEQWYAQSPEDDVYDGFTIYFTIPGLVINSDLPNTLHNNYIFKNDESIIINLTNPKYSKTLTKENNLEFLRLPTITFETEHGTKCIEFDNTMLKKNFNMYKYELIIPFIGFVLDDLEEEKSITNDIYYFATNNNSTELNNNNDNEETTSDTDDEECIQPIDSNKEANEQISKNYSVQNIEEETTIEILTSKEEQTTIDDDLKNLILQQISETKNKKI